MHHLCWCFLEKKCTSKMNKIQVKWVFLTCNDFHHKVEQLLHITNTHRQHFTFFVQIYNYLQNKIPSSVCDLALFNLFMSSVFFTHALFIMLTTLLTHIFHYMDAKSKKQQSPPSWKSDLNNVVGIDDIRDQRHK